MLAPKKNTTSTLSGLMGRYAHLARQLWSSAVQCKLILGIPYSSHGRSSGSQAQGTRFEPRQRHIKVGPRPRSNSSPWDRSAWPKSLGGPRQAFFGAKSRLFNFDLRFWRRNKPRQKLVPLTKLLHSSRSVDFRCYLGLPPTFRFSVLMGAAAPNGN